MFHIFKSNAASKVDSLQLCWRFRSCWPPATPRRNPPATYAQVPAGKAYAEGKEIYFTHTEASDPAIAEKLTNMMKSPVMYVPSLAKVPAEALANVYVFENGTDRQRPARLPAGCLQQSRPAPRAIPRCARSSWSNGRMGPRRPS